LAATAAKTTEREVEDTSTGDGTDSASFGGRVTAELCIDSAAHNVSLEPGTTFIV
jgi:hypothetical protein